MDLAKFESRVKELEQALHQSAAQHNAIIGQLAEAKNCLEILRAGVQKAEAVVEAVADVAKVVEGVTNPEATNAEEVQTVQ